MRVFLLLFSLCLAFSQSTLAQASTDKTASAMRIVALAPHIVEMLFELGVGEQIVGTVDYADHPEAAKAIPRVGGYYGMQVENILALKPDVVFAWRSGNKATDLEQLARLGLNIVYSQPDKIDDVAKELRYFGGIVNKPEVAEQVAVKFEQKLAKLRQQNAGKQQIKVFYQLWPEPMMTINKNTWIHQLVEICQGENVFANNPTDYPLISIENVMVAQPQLIILPDEKSKTVQPKIAWQNWPEIPAVKANAFIRVNADLLHRFSPRMLTGVEQLCRDIDLTRSALSDH